MKWGAVLLLVSALMGASAWAAWKWQTNAYTQQLADLKLKHQTALSELTSANSKLILQEQSKRLALEQRLEASNQRHYRALSDAQTNQARLRDRLATADVRLSALLASTDTTCGCSVPVTTASGRVVYGAQRAELDPAHAQRIISITDDGDQGLIALAACQEYAREIQKTAQ